MTSKRFASKVDAWLIAVLVVVVVIQLVALAAAAAEEAAAESLWIGAGALLFTVGLFTWLLRATYYEVGADTLRVVCGPFRRKIPISEITSVRPSRNPLSSPALSLDRLRIDYGKRFVLVSPADKSGFVAALKLGTGNANG